ncbi:MAG: M4 family metallopeptidase [Patescibacteria group bacterium]|jgi:Zn-dependent metalloprotease
MRKIQKYINIAIIAIFFCALNSAQAQEQLGLQYQLDKQTNLATAITRRNGPIIPAFTQKEATTAAAEFFQHYSKAFGLRDGIDQLSYINQETDALYQTHIRYNQYYDGVPVFGSQIIVHLNGDNSVRSANGKALPQLSLNTTPTLSSEEAITKAKQYASDNNQQTEFDTEEATLYIFNKSWLENTKTDTNNYLVWQVELYKDRPAFHEHYFINAHNGNLVFQTTGLMDAVHRHVYDCSYGAIDGNCYMSAYDGSYWVGRHEGDVATGSNPYPWITSKTETDDLYDFFGNQYDYYYTKFARNGANNLGGVGDGTTTYPSESTTGLTYIDFYYLSPDEEYAICPNAFFNGTNSIHFCQGEITDDLIGHEYGHAVNYFSILNESGAAAGLTYSGESGAINEANSDIFGEALEFYNDGISDWQHGEETDSGASRSMMDPSAYTYTVGGTTTPYPESYNDPNYYCGTEDNSGVHLNSSVGNYAAYLISEGGTVKGCTVTGLGEDAEEKIFYRAQTVYYTTSTTYNEAYTAILQSCYDLYGYGDGCKNVKKALKIVEMDSTGACNGGTLATDLTSVCAAVDAAPTITNITSEAADGYYKTGETIDIDIAFSDSVTSVGDVTLTLETGSTDQTCAFSVSNSAAAECVYTVQEGDNISEFNVLSISGTITDAEGDILASTTPAVNLADNKNIGLDTTKPKVPKYVKVYASSKKNRRIKTVNTRTYTGTVKDSSTHPYFTWQTGTDNLSGVDKYYVRFSSKKLDRGDVKMSKYKRSKRYLKTEVWDMEKVYRLYMIAVDEAGNTTKLKTLLKYQVESFLLPSAGFSRHGS